MMKRTIVGLLSVLCLCGSAVLNAEETAPSGGDRSFPREGRGGRGGREGRGGRGGRGGMFDPSRMPVIRRLAAEAQLKEQAPEEYAAAIKAQDAAAKAWSAAAAKAKVTLPEDTADQLRLVREKAPAEYEELLKLAGSDPHAALRKWREAAEKAGVKMMGFRGGRGDRGDRGGHGDREAPAPGGRKTSRVPMAKLRQAYPAEMAQYEELRKSDPAKARELLRDLSRKLDEAGHAPKN